LDAFDSTKRETVALHVHASATSGYQPAFPAAACATTSLANDAAGSGTADGRHRAI
jgi:hypothetical protein